MEKKLLDTLIKYFKKQKIRRGDLFENFLSFVYLFLNNDKYKGISLDILNYILSEKDMVMMKLSQK
tara:strand:+ start:396 stop:593 length:198 start_codon:yes stop_codon:yes gene_type:complete